MADRRRIYISGPMSGLPDFNYPAFGAAAQWLENQGWEPVSPADIGQREGWEWCDYMKAAVAMQTTCEAIHMLRGWHRSRGATVEHKLASVFGQFVTYEAAP